MWLGMAFDAIPSVYALERLVRPYAALRPAMIDRLKQDKAENRA